MLNDTQDAYGHLILDYYNGQGNVEIVERVDGFIDTSRLGPLIYFAEYDDWARIPKTRNDACHRTCFGHRLRCRTTCYLSSKTRA